MNIRGLFSRAVITLGDGFANNDNTSSRHSSMPLRLTYTPSQIDFIFGHINASLQRVDAKKAVPPDGSISFADKDSRKSYDDYVKVLNKEPQKCASELATLDRLRHSDIEYVIKVGGKQYGETAEGNTTTDGQRVLVNIRNVGGATGEKFDRNSRFAHELEHARQFDNGEFGFVKDSIGKWGPFFRSYDIMDEVRAFKAQLDVAPQIKDTPMLKRFRAAKTDEERSRILYDAGYSRLRQIDEQEGRVDRRVVFGANMGYKPGDVVRDSRTFARVSRIQK